MKSFSQRKGFKPVAEVLQIDSMNSELSKQPGVEDLMTKDENA